MIYAHTVHNFADYNIIIIGKISSLLSSQYLKSKIGDMKEKIIAALKTKYQNLGLSDAAFEAVALILSGSITDEANIETVINGVEASLKSFQSDVDRRVNTIKAENEKLKKQQSKGQEQGGAPAASGKDTTETKTDDMPAWAKALLEQNKTLTKGLAELRTGKVADTRKQVLETRLKDTDEKFRTKVLKDFGRMNFETDDDFNAYVDETVADSKDFAQTVIDKSLGAQGKPLQGTAAANAKAIDADIKAWAEKNQPKVATEK